MIAVAIAIVISLFSCIQTQATECATTYPICGEGSTLCPHNMCTKPNGGKCNMSGDGCLDIRWNRDSCLSPENTCGSGYCGERDPILVSVLKAFVDWPPSSKPGIPPDFSDCACDNGACIVVGPQNTFAPTSTSPSSSPTKEPSKSPSESPTTKEPTAKPTPEVSLPTQERNLPTSDVSAPPSDSTRPTISSVPSLIESSEAPSLSTQPSMSNKPSVSARPTTSDGSKMTKSGFTIILAMYFYFYGIGV